MAANLRWTDEATGLVCQAVQLHVLRTPHWCGYVLIPPNHHWHGKDYDDIHGVSIHGGLTYADKDGPDWKVGFDAGHAGDGWQDEAWVRRECADLARQAAEVQHGR